MTNDGRFVFGVPWGGRIYAGTTDTDYDGDLDDPVATDSDIDYVVRAMAGAFSVTRADVVASWAGLRPLLALGGRSTSDLSRRHAVYESPPGLLTITGGKLTTYRAMAEDLVDRACRMLDEPAPCRTASICRSRSRGANSAIRDRRPLDTRHDDTADAKQHIRERVWETL